MKDVAESCSSNATGSPQALSRRKTLHVVALASRPLSEMTSCFAPSPAVMSSLETSATRSAEPASRWIFLVLPSLRTAPSVNFEEWVVLASKAGSFLPSCRGNEHSITARLGSQCERWWRPLLGVDNSGDGKPTNSALPRSGRQSRGTLGGTRRPSDR